MVGDSADQRLLVRFCEMPFRHELGKNVIPRGGYNSREQFVRDLTSRLEIEYAKHYGLTRALASMSGKRVRARG